MNKFIVLMGLIGLFLLSPTPARADGNCNMAIRWFNQCPSDLPVFCGSYGTPPDNQETLCCKTTEDCLAQNPTATPGVFQVKSPVPQVCDYAGTSRDDCLHCMIGGKGAWTAIGCVPSTGPGLFQNVFAVGTGIAGGIAFLLIIFGGFQMMTSAGNPEQLNAGKELVTSAVAGLLLIIFSVFLLKLIGYNILGIPGFG